MEGRNEETRFRFFPHGSRPERDLAVKHWTRDEGQGSRFLLELNTYSTDTSVAEKWVGNVLSFVRIYNINESWMERFFFRMYDKITRLEFGSPVSAPWIFQYVHQLRNLQSVRFGKQSSVLHFVARSDEPHVVNEKNPTVLSLEIDYDPVMYSKVSETIRKNMEQNLIQLLRLSRNGFPELRGCQVQVPKLLKSDLEDFIKGYPHMYKRGEIREKLAGAMVGFICRMDSGSSAQGPPQDTRKRSHNGQGRAPESASKRSAVVAQSQKGRPASSATREDPGGSKIPDLLMRPTNGTTQGSSRTNHHQPQQQPQPKNFQSPAKPNHSERESKRARPQTLQLNHNNNNSSLRNRLQEQSVEQPPPLRSGIDTPESPIGNGLHSEDDEISGTPTPPLTPILVPRPHLGIDAMTLVDLQSPEARPAAATAANRPPAAAPRRARRNPTSSPPAVFVTLEPVHDVISLDDDDD